MRATRWAAGVDSTSPLLLVELRHADAPKSEKRGKKPVYDLRRVLDSCFYVLRGGIARRMMPHDLPPWHVVYDHFSDWRHTGKWERINAVLRERTA